MAQEMSGKTCVVTGASSGIGAEIARGLAAMGARVVMVCRDRARGEAARAAIASETGSQVDLLIADLLSQHEVRRVAGQILDVCPRLDVLVNNAGAVFGRRVLTEDGIEATFALNHLAYFLLTTLLLDRLRVTPGARVVNVASAAHRMGRIDFDNLRGEGRYGAQRMYARSKLANILFTRELARRLRGTGILVNCFHPGVVATRFGDSGSSFFRRLVKLGRPFMRGPRKGAETGIWLATSPDVTTSGGYYFDRRETYSSDDARNAELAKTLWLESQALVAGSE
jgi:NAD(P)-dependent dehydrogenase (short-subunit alcohol dehydrogenase family)